MTKGGITYCNNTNMKTFKQQTSDQNRTGDAYTRLDVDGTRANVRRDS